MSTKKPATRTRWLSLGVAGIGGASFLSDVGHRDSNRTAPKRERGRVEDVLSRVNYPLWGITG